MRFLADECCDAALVDALRDDGHDVLYAVESLRGATDDEIWPALSRSDASSSPRTKTLESWSTVSDGRRTESFCYGLT